MTYTTHEFGQYLLYVNDETGKVHHAVVYRNANWSTVYPYKRDKRRGIWNNAVDVYTLAGFRAAYRRGTVCLT